MAQERGESSDVYLPCASRQRRPFVTFRRPFVTFRSVSRRSAPHSLTIDVVVGVFV